MREREVFKKELVHTVIEATKSKIYNVSLQAGYPGKNRYCGSRPKTAVFNYLLLG